MLPSSASVSGSRLQDVAEISAVGELLVSGIAGARAAVIENADHVVPWRAPDELAGLILEFLA